MGNKKSREEFLSRMHGFLEFRGPAMSCPYFLEAPLNKVVSHLRSRFHPAHGSHGTLATAHLTSVLEALA